jgi:hypothetical protein
MTALEELIATADRLCKNLEMAAQNEKKYTTNICLALRSRVVSFFDCNAIFERMGRKKSLIRSVPKNASNFTLREVFTYSLKPDFTV